MAEFKTICRVGAVAEGAGAAFPISDTIVAIFRRDDEYYAINDFCPHMGASLSEGHFEDGDVMCPWHAWRFCVSDGTWCDNPSIKTDTYEVRVVGDEVQVKIDDEPAVSMENDESDEPSGC